MTVLPTQEQFRRQWPHLSTEFASTWPTYVLDPKTHALLTYAKKVTEAPSMISDADIDALKDADWDDRGIYEATMLTVCFNMTGRVEAVSGLPADTVPENSQMAEGRPDHAGAGSSG